MIALDHLTKRYGSGPPAVTELSFEVVTGEVCILIGPSGCGKSTTLRMINRLIDPTSGHIWIDGEDVLTVDPSGNSQAAGRLTGNYVRLAR